MSHTEIFLSLSWQALIAVIVDLLSAKFCVKFLSW
jgi:hypothetical protein